MNAAIELRLNASDIVDMIGQMRNLSSDQVMLICNALQASAHPAADYYLIPLRVNGKQASEIISKLRDAFDAGLYEGDQQELVGDCQSQMDVLMEGLHVVEHTYQAEKEQAEIQERVEQSNRFWGIRT